jgi:hypothetical protein
MTPHGIQFPADPAVIVGSRHRGHAAKPQGVVGDPMGGRGEMPQGGGFVVLGHISW